jgi:uncharacterized protein (DUF1800 family)
MNMNGGRGWFGRWTSWVALALVLFATPLALRAADAGSDDPNNPVKRPATAEEKLRNRMNEALSGRRDITAPRSKTLIGPDLNEREKTMHVLDRMSFGATPGQVDEIMKNGGWQAWVKTQMDPDHIDDATVTRIVPERFPFVKMSMAQLKHKYNGKEAREELSELKSQLPALVLTRAALSNKQFYEVMCDFWRNHFCVDQPGKYELTRSWTDVDYEQNVIRKHAFGKFGDMLFASARHPAMLEYLDNKLSYKNNWNENYAREVMELHTVGVDKGYRDIDVQELSKALTGWTYNGNFEFVFNEQEHQPGAKHWMGMSLPAGFDGGVIALRTLATSPATADFISLKLCRYLVNDNPPMTLVKKISSVFHSSNGDLPKVYEAIINSPEFMTRDNYRCKFKSPLFFTVSALRATQAKVDNTIATTEVLRKMGEPVYDCPDPTGYFDAAERWMDAGVLTSRWQYAWDLVRGSVDGVSLTDNFLNRYKGLKPEELQQKLIDDLLEGEVGDRELAALKETAPTGDLQRMISIVLGSPSFQQR